MSIINTCRNTSLTCLIVVVVPQILIATGREPDTKLLGLDKAGVEMTK